MGLTACIVFVLGGSASGQGLVPTGTLLVLPHIAHGDQVNGRWRTSFVFVNNSNSTTQGTLFLVGDSGQDLVLGTGRGTNSNFDITIPAHGQFEVETDGIGSLRTGWAVAFFDHAVLGSAVFSFTRAEGKVVTVGVLSTNPKSAFLTPAEGRTGIAVANPFNRTQTLEMQAYNSNGSLVATRTLTMAPGSHTSNVVTGLFSGLSSSFAGSVKIRSDFFFSALAIGFVPNSSFDAGFSVPAISYDRLARSYSGNWESVVFVDFGSATFSNLEHFDSNMFTGSVLVNDQASGLTASGPVLGNVDDFGLLYSFSFELDSTGEIAVAELQPDGSFLGGFVDLDGGDLGIFQLSPQSSAGSTLRTSSTRQVVHPVRKWSEAELWVTPKYGSQGQN